METTKYLIDDEEVTQDEFYMRLEEEADNNANDSYDDMLDDCYDEVVIGTLRYCPSSVLKQVDPVAYRCGRSDYQSSLLSDYQYELERYDEVVVNGITFKVEYVNI